MIYRAELISQPVLYMVTLSCNVQVIVTISNHRVLNWQMEVYL